MTPTPVGRALLDTSVVIDYREAVPDAVQLIIAIRRHRQPEFSQITALALLARCQDQIDIDNIRVFFTISMIHVGTAWTMRRAQQILERHPPPAPLTADDAIIAATAMQHKLPLYTLDPIRFAGVAGLTAVRPY